MCWRSVIGLVTFVDVLASSARSYVGVALGHLAFGLDDAQSQVALGHRQHLVLMVFGLLGSVQS
ncbi:hypothetical protein LR48_Vigan08g136300 [Vigna angularis]|uniref:Uncharacterized protein n=1 Tax=Phaseolus angularis TaxID=3914 RepID=A0A0L9V668_PHAAN|nr:hypothetical protein LR48_Vigan08g136300 [Vigna angularis]